MLSPDTSAIIIGRPSGTATTMMTTASVTDETRSRRICITLAAEKYAVAPGSSVGLKKIQLIIKAIAMSVPPIYQNLEIVSATLPSLTFSGDSRSSSSLSSCARRPNCDLSPTHLTFMMASPFVTTEPR